MDLGPLWDWLAGIGDWLESIWEVISSLPSKIGETIKGILIEIFVPDTEVIQDRFDQCIENITTSIGMPLDSLEFLGDSISERPIPNEEGDYAIPGVGTFHLTFFDATFLKDAVNNFRPVIRGFIVLLLVFFVYRSIISFMGFDPGILQNGGSESAGLKTDKSNKGGDKS